MAATKNQYELSQVIVRRSKELAKVGEPDMKKESDRFFYWIMQQMAEKVERHWGRDEYILNFRVITSNNHVTVYYSGEYNSNTYVPCLISKKKQFCEVIKEVTDIINQLPNFKASYIRNTGLGDTNMYITMSTSQKRRTVI